MRACVCARVRASACVRLRLWLGRVYMCMWVCLHVRACVRVCVCVFVNAYVHVCVCCYMRSYVRIYVSTDSRCAMMMQLSNFRHAVCAAFPTAADTQ